MNRNNGPISPLSMNSTESGFVSRYGNMGGPSPVPTPPPSDSGPYTSGAPYGAARPPGAPASPPGSQHPSGSTDMSRPSAHSSVSGSQRPPSSASSAGGRSDGRPPPNGRPMFKPEHEAALHKHYMMLQQYLASSLRDEKGNIKPNRARDKLLRLSVTQFMELSTDVFDELVRREDERLQRVPNVPRFLLPKNTFHPKRNQARQKLSTLPLDRFRQLATDVFYELERRVPRFSANGSRPPSTASSVSSRRPSEQGGRRPSGPGMRPPMPGYRGPPGGPPGPMSPGFGPGPNGPPPPNGMRPGGPPGGPPGQRSRAPSEQSEPSSLGRPLPKTFQSNTIVPNKSTMVEDDDDEEGDPLDRSRFSEAQGSLAGSEKDRETIRNQEAELTRLREELNEQITVSGERGQWKALREELEQKALDAERLRESMQEEIDTLKREKEEDQRAQAENDQDLADIRSRLDSLRTENENLHAQNEDMQHQMHNHQAEVQELREQSHQGGSADSDHRIQLLEEQLATQEKLTNEVRDEATLYLHEMRDLSRQTESAIEQEEKMAAQVTKLEKEIDIWRERYAKAKAQNKALRASTLGLGLSAVDMSSLSRSDSFISPDGLVCDVDITKFQLSVDELLKSARQPGTDAMLESVKQVTLCVSSISSTIGTDGYPTPSPSPHSPTSAPPSTSPSVAKLKARVTGTANSLITATKQHASASGLSPVALLDAAASNLTAAVVELVKAVGVRPSSASELQDASADLDSIYSPDPAYPSPSIDLARSHDSMAYNGNVDSPPVPPLNVANGQAKKANNWFGWGKGTSVDGSPRLSTDEYDVYR